MSARSKIRGGGGSRHGSFPYAPDRLSRKARAQANVGDMDAIPALTSDASCRPVVDATRRRSRHAPGSSRARHALSADLPRLSRGDGFARRALPALLERDAVHRAALLRAPRDAVRAGPRAGPHLAPGDGRSARVRPRPGGGAVRGRAGAHARPSAQIFRPRRARAADRRAGWSARARTCSPTPIS